MTRGTGAGNAAAVPRGETEVGVKKGGGTTGVITDGLHRCRRLAIGNVTVIMVGKEIGDVGQVVVIVTIGGDEVSLRILSLLGSLRLCIAGFIDHLSLPQVEYW